MERIIVRNVSKRFNIGLKKKQSTLQRIVSILPGEGPKRYIWALRNLSFSANSGEIVGIIGYNGSGKSTLLRVISGIYKEDCGSIETKGKVVSVLGMGAGFNERFTMKDNIYLTCTLLGMSRREIKRRFNGIVDFTGIGQFLNTELYKFSSGMVQRLSFSIAVHCDLEVLLLDEVFEVGDKNFRKLTAKKICELAKEGATVLFVSHEIVNILDYCDRVIWIHNGEIVMEGEPKRVCSAYMKS